MEPLTDVITKLDCIVVCVCVCLPLLPPYLFYTVSSSSYVCQIREAHAMGAKLANVDPQGLTPLHHAARLGRKEVVKYIVDNSKSHDKM